jgi:hypothetical protein
MVKRKYTYEEEMRWYKIVRDFVLLWRQLSR